jgi:hypothetical protein
MATTNLSHYDKTTIPNANHFRFGIVVSEWNPDITENLKKGAIKTLLDCGAKQENILSWKVPGSFELIYGCKKMIKTLQLDAIIAIGNVIQGEMGAAFGLDNEWNLRIIKQVGNYGESYKRNIADTGILPDRGPNELWTKGGILYVPPSR